jgi:hypothetical protein
MCSSCGKSSTPYIQTIVQQTIIEPCNYVLNDAIFFFNILKCMKEKSLIDSQTLNSYNGVLKSVFNSPTYICSFKRNLDIIQNHILSLNDCL